MCEVTGFYRLDDSLCVDLGEFFEEGVYSLLAMFSYAGFIGHLGEHEVGHV